MAKTVSSRKTLARAPAGDTAPPFEALDGQIAEMQSAPAPSRSDGPTRRRSRRPRPMYHARCFSGYKFLSASTAARHD